MELTLGVRVSHLTKSFPHICQSYQVKYQLGSETFVWTPPPKKKQQKKTRELGVLEWLQLHFVAF